MNETTLLTGMLCGSVGVGYVIYGRKRQSMTSFLAGVALCAMPYFISDVRTLVVLSIVAMAAPILRSRLAFRGR